MWHRQHSFWGRQTWGMACWLLLLAQQDAVECSYLKVTRVSCDGTHEYASNVYLWFFDHVDGVIGVQCPRCVFVRVLLLRLPLGEMMCMASRAA